MLISSVQEFSLKTLQKWATLPKSEEHFCKNQFNHPIKSITKATTTTATTKTTKIARATATATIIFKEEVQQQQQKFSTISNIKSIIKLIVTSISSLQIRSIVVSTTTATATATATITPLPSPSSSPSSSSTSTSTSKTTLFNSFNILLSTVIKKLSFLMNDIRIKSLYKITIASTNNKKNNNNNKKKKNFNNNKKTNNSSYNKKNINYKSNNKNNNNSSSCSSNSDSNNNNSHRSNRKSTNCFNRNLGFAINLASSIVRKLCKNKNNSNHRTYNNSSKSNKVFLHYTTRDPRLWIFNCNQFILFNKHLATTTTKSELSITEDLCNYGEVIGGGQSSSSLSSASLSPSSLLIVNNVESNCLNCENFQKEKSSVKNQCVKFCVKNNCNSVNVASIIEEETTSSERTLVDKNSSENGNKSVSILTALEKFYYTFKAHLTALLIV